jgi:hypothetical protein
MTLTQEEVPIPIACSLSAAELPARLAEMTALGSEALIDIERSDQIATLRFDRSPGIADRVAAIVAAESECCAFLRTELSDDAGRLVLTITAPPGGEPVLDDLVAAFSATGGGGMSAESKSSRRSGSVVAGTALLMVLCCAIGPAVAGAALGSLIGGWLGIACAVIAAAGVALYVVSRRGRGRC